MAATLDDLLAKQEITELVYCYAHAIDRRDCDLLERLFTPDADAERWWDRLGSGALTGGGEDDPAHGFGLLDDDGRV